MEFPQRETTHLSEGHITGYKEDSRLASVTSEVKTRRRCLITEGVLSSLTPCLCTFCAGSRGTCVSLTGGELRGCFGYNE